MLTPGEIIDGKYRVERLLGQGGMGAVFEGYHTLVERRVAIKVLLPEVTASRDGSMRFDREVRAAGRIGSDHILEIYDVGSLPDGSRYMVSEFLDGETLSSRLSRGPLSPAQAAHFMLQLLTGLAAAHQSGIVHRDLKPDNIFLVRKKSGQTDFVKIIDFGISKFELDSSARAMTVTGAVLGTPYYLSPEQARGQRDIDARSDLYAVGVVLYEALTGRVPFDGQSFNELLFKIALETPPSLLDVLPGIDPRFSDLVHKAMERDREQRFQSAHAMREAIAAFLATTSQEQVNGPPPRAFVTSAAPALLRAATASNFGRTNPLDARTKPPGLSRYWPWAASFVFAASLAGLGAWLLRPSTRVEPNQSAATPSRRPAPAAPSTAMEPSPAPAVGQPPPTAPPLEPTASAELARPLPPPPQSEPPPRSEPPRNEAARKRTPRAVATARATPPTAAPRAAPVPPPAAPPTKAKQERDFGY